MATKLILILTCLPSAAATTSGSGHQQPEGSSPGMASVVEVEWDFVFCGNSYYRTFVERPRQRGGQAPPLRTVKVMLLGNGPWRSQVWEALKDVTESIDFMLPFQILTKFFRGKEKESDLRLAMMDIIPPSPNPEILKNLSMDEIHVIVLVVRADQPPDMAPLVQRVEHWFGPEWHCHTLVVFTNAVQLKKSGLRPVDYFASMPDSIRALARRVGGGYLFFDHHGGWPSVAGRALREHLFQVSAQNHHKALKIICSSEASHFD
ncbi:uncharacterized protein ACB058_001437 [Synchiropus picturatus]